MILKQKNYDCKKGVLYYREVVGGANSVLTHGYGVNFEVGSECQASLL